MKTQKILEKAKIGLILNEPFFASACLQLEYAENDEIETGRTNGITIEYNPDFLTSMQAEERKGFIAHELLHILSLHNLRTEGRDIKKWNVACDYAINPLLKDAGFSLPKGGLIDSKYFGKSAEEIYSMLPDTDKDNEAGGYGEVAPQPKGEDPQQMEQAAKQMAAEAVNAAKQAGKISKGLQELIDDLLEPKYDWKELLYRFVSEVVHNDYTWSKPNPRFIPSGLYLPILESLEVGKVVFAIDTSGSIDTRLLSEIIAELKEAMSLFSVPVTVIHCDTKVQKVEELHEDDTITPVGRGGTNFQPVFDYVNEHLEDAKAIIYFTDGDASDRYKEPDCPVMWMIYDNKRFKCDFGEIIHVERSKN